MVERSQGDDRRKDGERQQVKIISIKEYFLEYLFPDAITYGMSYEEFWQNDPNLFASYRFSYFKQFKMNQRVSNYNAWLQGNYNYIALMTTMGNMHRGKGEQAIPYLDKPFDFENKVEHKSEKEKQQDRKISWANIKGRSLKQYEHRNARSSSEN